MTSKPKGTDTCWIMWNNDTLIQSINLTHNAYTLDVKE